MTIDLKSQVVVDGRYDDYMAAIYVDSPNVVIKNIERIASGRSGFVFSPRAKHILIDNVNGITEKDYFPEEYAVFQRGNEDITFQNLRLQGYYASSGLLYFDGNAAYSDAADPIRNLTFDNVFVSYVEGGSCGAVDGSGCRTYLLGGTYPNLIDVDGFTWKNSKVQNPASGLRSLTFAEVDGVRGFRSLANLQVTDSKFLGVVGPSGAALSRALISIPDGGLEGQNVISGNVFQRSSTGSGLVWGITWLGPNRDTKTDLVISDNYFDGFTYGSIAVQRAGGVRVERNTIGSKTGAGSQTTTEREETSQVRNLMFSVLYNNTVGGTRINTWRPSESGRVLETAKAPAETIKIDTALEQDAQYCTVTLDIEAPDTNGPEVADVDVFWTESKYAEIYLGRAKALTGADASLEIDLPVGIYEFPSDTVGEHYTQQIVDPATGEISGYLRLQTQDAKDTDAYESSQYSEVAAVTGNCFPRLSVQHHEQQNTPTKARDLVWTVTSSLPLDAGGLEDTLNGEFVGDMSAELIDGMSIAADGGELNPRVFSVEVVPNTENRVFTVKGKVDDSATVELNIGPGKVRTVGGLSNLDAATKVDASDTQVNDIVFHNPLSLSPQSFTLVTGDPDGKDFQYAVANGAPTPTAQLNFDLIADPNNEFENLELSTYSATIEPDKMTSNKVRAVAGVGNIEANTPAKFKTTVSSDDTNYDGLLLKDLHIRLFSTDPSIEITKKAYVGADMDTRTVESIINTGREVPVGARLLDREKVCFVYEVSNISKDDWATSLTNIHVTDTDVRLGDGGLIGTIPNLPSGGGPESSTMLAACGTLIALDTTVSGDGSWVLTLTADGVDV